MVCFKYVIIYILCKDEKHNTNNTKYYYTNNNSCDSNLLGYKSVWIGLLLLPPLLPLFPLLLLLRWYCCPTRTLASLMDFSQSAMFLNLFPAFNFILISVHISTICFLVVLLGDFPEDYC